MQRGATRRQILLQLCAAPQTAIELAHTLGITATAVRDHLARLAEEDLVKHRIARRGVGKPTHVYELTSEGELFTSKAYLPVLGAVLDTAAQRNDRGLEKLLRETGHTLAKQQPQAEGSLRHRTTVATKIINRLGGVAEATRLGDGYVIDGRCCPLSHLSGRIPQLCKMLETMLSEVTGCEIVEDCDRNGRPHCRFAVNTAKQ